MGGGRPCIATGIGVRLETGGGVSAASSVGTRPATVSDGSGVAAWLATPRFTSTGGGGGIRNGGAGGENDRAASARVTGEAACFAAGGVEGLVGTSREPSPGSVRAENSGATPCRARVDCKPLVVTGARPAPTKKLAASGRVSARLARHLRQVSCTGLSPIPGDYLACSALTWQLLGIVVPHRNINPPHPPR